MALYLLTEDGGHILIEDNTGALLLEESPTPYWDGSLALEKASIHPHSYQVDRDRGVW